MTFRREVSPQFAALMEENKGSLTDGETKKVRVISTEKPVSGATKRGVDGKHKILKVLGGAV